MATSIFVTATDTGIGKTYVTALLLRELRRRGIRAAAFKPISCGEGGRNDARIYHELMNGEVPLDVVNPIYLRHPLAPSVAAKLERRRMNLQPVFRAYSLLTTHYSLVLVEGAGGLMVPILPRCHSERSETAVGRLSCDGKSLSFRGEALPLRKLRASAHSAQGDKAKKDRPYFVADLALELGLPLLIVSRLGLGTINHTLLTVRQAQAMGLKVKGIVLNDTTGQRGLAEKTNVTAIPELCGVPLLGVMPHGPKGSRAAARRICRALVR